MGRKKKITFKLDPEWMLKEPVDFEYNKYTLLGYLQKCHKGFDKLEIYPDFVELSLHLANIQSLVKENTLLLTDKKFEYCDDEILLKELVTKKARQLSDDESYELDKTIRYSGNKLFDAFNLAKSIWSLAHDSVETNLRKNKKNISDGIGFSFYVMKSTNTLYVWEYHIKRPKNFNFSTKTSLKLIFEGSQTESSISDIIENLSTFSEKVNVKDLPIFETKSSQDFPMEQTFIPIMRRKITAYTLQETPLNKRKNFDYK